MAGSTSGEAAQNAGFAGGPKGKGASPSHPSLSANNREKGHNNLRQHKVSTAVPYREIDFLAGWRFRPNYMGSLVAGRCYPGKAFSSDADKALYAEFEPELVFQLRVPCLVLQLSLLR